MSNPELEQKFERFRADFEGLRHEIGKAIVGQEEVVGGVLTALVVGGHVLIEGLPGMGKTALAHTLADVVDVSFQRIACTPDLMSADIIGTYVIMETPQGRRTGRSHTRAARRMAGADRREAAGRTRSTGPGRSRLVM